MLIKALCDYYDKVMVPSKEAAPKGYSKIEISHTIHLRPDGTVAYINSCNDKREPIFVPKRMEKTCPNSEIIEHRAKYIFGLELKNAKFCLSKKYHKLFKEKNLEFIKGIDDSDIVNAYRNFILNWQPEKEIKNKYLLEISKDYNGAKFEFKLFGEEIYLHNDKKVIDKWNCEKEKWISLGKGGEAVITSQCAIYGENKTVARTHNTIRGIKSGQPSGTVLVSFDKDAERSYGKEKSYNSNISNDAMEKYTEALNYILNTKNNKIILGDITVTFWAVDKESKKERKCENLFAELLNRNSDKEDAAGTENILKKLLSFAKNGGLLESQISDLDDIDPNVDFYIVGLKPNASRLAVKFIYRRKYGQILQNIAKHQSDLQISEDINIVPIWKLQKAIMPMASDKEIVNPEIITKIFKSIIYGYRYPEALLSAALNRFKVDASKVDSKEDVKNKKQRESRCRLQAGIIKACINRKSLNEEELKMSLDENNQNSAYICGRLFAVLEKIQQGSAGNGLNRTIKNSYFSSACSRPASVFPQILKVIFDVENGNPNGDPDAGNNPRIDAETGIGLVTDVCLKRKIRNYVELVKNGEKGYNILIKADKALNSKFEDAYKENDLQLGKKEKNPKSETVKMARDYMCANYYDVRTFGAVMSTGDNPCGIVRGPVQINFAKSISPINIQDITITRQGRTKQKDHDTGNTTEMGRKSIVPYALYRSDGYISANLAQNVTKFNEDDLNLLWEAIINMFEHDHSAARGKMCMRKLYIFKHDNILGNCPSNVLFDKITIKPLADTPRNFLDYDVAIDENMPNGVTFTSKI